MLDETNAQPATANANQGRYVCERCVTRSDEKSPCPCGGDRFDLYDPMARQLLLDDDERARTNRERQLKWVAVPLGPAVAVLGGLALPILSEALPGGPLLGSFLLAIAVSVGAFFGFRAAFGIKPKFAFVLDIVSAEVARDLSKQTGHDVAQQAHPMPSALGQPMPQPLVPNPRQQWDGQLFPRPGYKSFEGHNLLKQRAWLTGVLAAIAHVLLPIVVVVAAFATALSAMGAALESPDVDPRSAAVHDGRVWFVASGRESGVTTHLLSSAPIDGGAPIPETKLEAEGTLVSAQGRLLFFDGSRVQWFEEGKMHTALAYPEPPSIAHDASRPFLHDGKPAIAFIQSDDHISGVVHVLDGDHWERGPDVSFAAPNSARLSSLQFATQGDKLYAYVQDYDDDVYKLGGGAPEPVAHHARGFVVAQVGSVPRLFVTRGPSLDELLDDAPHEEATITAYDQHGKKLAQTAVAGAHEVGVVPVDTRRQLVLTEDDDGLDLLPFDDEKFGAAIATSSNRFLPFIVSAAGLLFAWVFGDYLITLLLAFAMSRGMSRHRVTEYQGYKPVAFASLTRRVLARMIDGGLTTVACGAAAFAAHRFGSDPTWPAMLTATVVGMGLLALEGATGASPGRWVVGIRVVNTQLEPPGFYAALVRTFLLVWDGFFFGMVGIYIAAFSPYWQRLGDEKAGTIVIRTPKKEPAEHADLSAIPSPSGAGP